MRNRYLAITSAWWQRALTYRNLVIVYRFTDIVEALVLVALWLRIYETQDVVRGFTQNEMLTYVLVGGLFFIFTRNFTAETVAEDIRTGKLSNFLTKPISYLRYFLAMAQGRIIHMIVGGTTQLILIAIFYRYIVHEVSLGGLLVIALMLIISYYNELLISFAIGTIAFWTEDVDGMYFTISQVRRFLSGYFFPLTLLPAALTAVAYYTPFAYRYFVPMEIFLGKANVMDGVRGIGICLLWTLLLHVIIAFLWRRGIKQYEGVNI